MQTPLRSIFVETRTGLRYPGCRLKTVLCCPLLKLVNGLTAAASNLFTSSGYFLQGGTCGYAFGIKRIALLYLFFTAFYEGQRFFREMRLQLDMNAIILGLGIPAMNTYNNTVY